MRILLVAQFFPPDIGGEERHVFNLGNILAARGHAVTVATQRIPGSPDHEVLPSSVHVRRFPTMAMSLPGVYSTSRPHHPPVPDPLGVRALRQIVREVRPDVVHAHNWAVNSMLPVRGWPAKHKSFGFVLTLHDYSQVCATKRLMRDGALCEGPSARCLPCAAGHYGRIVGPPTVLATAAIRPWKTHSIDHIVSVSRAVASANHIADGPRGSVVPNFIPDALVQAPDASAAASTASHAHLDLPDEKFLLFVGDISKDKGTHTLLRAYERLGADRPPLVLIGRRTPDTPENLPAGASVREEWPHPHVLEAFRRSAAAVLPSVWPDPCPTTVLESMASGAPVITTSIGGMVDMVVNEESGLLVSPGNEIELATAMESVLKDEDLRSRITRGARDKVRNFTASAVVERLEAIYAQVAPSTGGDSDVS
ncbi:glycosyltransferase family 1 protein [Trebonia kvetii]|uniref:Glycosyltransferase family 1 protein n=1 Tax=Trebonia kvetii TaxID=2480626 RepID=A0A6P2BPC8_9ACTN|nr:glycosyltransferase family 4 protein [Trebonia kvetii]TVZ00056.1 glycosyltransferase family 1 protein [Trebonia kvetii]